MSIVVILHKINYLYTKINFIFRFSKLINSSTMYMMSFSIIALLNLDKYLLIDNHTPTGFHKALLGL